MARPRVLILRAPGTNCDEETAFAFERAGGVAERVHVNRWLETPRLAEQFQVLCLPGGFSYGDDIAAGRILAARLQHHLSQPLADFIAAGKLVLGICNGFQVLMRAGILPESVAEIGPSATLAWNDSGRFEDRWVHLSVSAGSSVFLQGIERLYLPVAHAEGKFVARDEQTLQRLDDSGQLVMRYATSEGQTDRVPYPANPNGSQANVAGVCDATGRVLGLMPHPERHIEPTQHPRWTRGEADPAQNGLRIFENAVRFFQ